MKRLTELNGWTDPHHSTRGRTLFGARLHPATWHTEVPHCTLLAHGTVSEGCVQSCIDKAMQVPAVKAELAAPPGISIGKHDRSRMPRADIFVLLLATKPKEQGVYE